MNVKIQSVRFDADQKLVAFTEEKVQKLDRFSEKIISADVILKIDKDPEHGNKVATIKLDVEGSEIVADRQCKSFEEAIDQCIDALKKQLEKHKEKSLK